MRKLIVAALIAAFVFSMMTGAYAVTWKKIGTSGFTNSNLAGLRDLKRIQLSDLEIDANGNIYGICNNGENGTYNYTGSNSSYPYAPQASNWAYTDANGGVTIWAPNGTKLYDVKVCTTEDSNFSTYYRWGPDWEEYGWPNRGDKKLAGAITKLVKAGDGKIYALMNWTEIGFDFQRQNQRIVRINSDGTVTPIYDARDTAAVTNDIVVGAFQWQGTGGWQERASRIRGLTVGSDGNLYWTNNAAHYYFKAHLLWKYDVASGTVSEAPINSTNNGWSETHRLFDIEYVGKDSANNDSFAILNCGNKWRADKIGWSVNRSAVTGGETSSDDRRDWITATAYDPINNKLWVGGRGKPYTRPSPWSKDIWEGSTFERVNDDYYKFTSGDGAHDYYRMNMAANDTVATIAARFKCSAYANGSGGTLDKAVLTVQLPGSPAPSVWIATVGSNWVVKDGSGATLYTLGAINTSNYETAYIILDKGASNVKVYWNGTKVYDGTFGTSAWTNTWGAWMFGGSIRDRGTNGSSTIWFDWVKCANYAVTPTTGSWPTAWYMTPDGEDLDVGTVIDSCLVTRWNGTPGGSGLFNILEGNESMHANNNDPEVTKVTNGGQYWVNTIAVNPADGSAWMAWGADTAYNYGDYGKVLRRGLNLAEFTDEGMPEQGAAVMAIAFDANYTPYALTCNTTTGEYNLYTADYESGSITDIKKRVVGSLVQTDAKKIVTFVSSAGDYFYIQEGTVFGESPNTFERQICGIKVKLSSGTAPSVGDMVQVKGRLAVINYEATIKDATIVSSSSPSEPVAKPYATAIRNIGGLAFGSQPFINNPLDTTQPPYGLNTVGMLVRVAGKVKYITPSGDDQDPGEASNWFTIDDGSNASTMYNSFNNGAGYVVSGLKIDFAPGSLAVGDNVAVTGVVGVRPVDSDGDNTYDTWQRVILPRTSADITTF